MNIWSHIETLILEWIFGTTLKPRCSNEYLVTPWNLDAWMNIWSHLETLILEWIFGITLKPWCSNEFLVTPWNLDTRMNIWSYLEILILEWTICMDIKWYVCKCNAGPGEMLLMQPGLQSGTKHSCFLFTTFNFAWQSTCWAEKLTSLSTIAWKC